VVRWADMGKRIIIAGLDTDYLGRPFHPMPELLAVADRIIVLCEGRLTAEIPRDQATEEVIMHAATRFLDRSKTTNDDE
jgi:hypothetical protein